MKKYYGTTTPEMTDFEKKHMELSRKLASECVVLLENDGTLPIKKKCSIALYGEGVRKTVKGGTGSGNVHSRINVTIEEGVKQAGFTVTTQNWLDRYDQDCKNKEEKHRLFVKKKAEEMGTSEVMLSYSYPMGAVPPILVTEEDIQTSDTDTAVYVISRNSGEGKDRSYIKGDYLPFDEEIENLKILAKYYTKVVLVLNIGGVMELTEIKKIEGISAIVLMGQLGNIGGHALADILSGKVNPSGKLTDSWAKSYMDYPSSEEFSDNDGDVNDEYYKDGIYVGYRYFDTFQVEPQYPFGYGKSYTEFSVQCQSVLVKDRQVVVEASVRNTGNQFSGKEVVQVYYSAPVGNMEKPYQELAAFAKTKELRQGETQKLCLQFDIADMASYSEELSAWVLESGSYIVKLGDSSKNNENIAEIVIRDTICTEKLMNCFKDEKELVEIQPETGSKTKDLGGKCQKIVISSDILTCKNHDYTLKRKVFKTEREKVLTLEDVKSGNCTTEELTAQLTVEEMADLCVGTERATIQEIIGKASLSIPGAAGETTSALEETRKINRIIMADGPAGLRLQPHFKTTKDGEVLPGGSIVGNICVEFDESLDKDDVVDYYQYCTAIPIGWALAQSWNTDLVEHFGDIIGTEMEQFHIDLWLAPALNIHRNPLCGRNFEYYSEDPLVSGKIAAAMTVGVQNHSGKGVTIKHFAANNQENNRYFTNSHVSERALREIYLKGFEIAVKDAAPYAVMTSYNLLNGIHTANHYDLLQNVLRNEWGFDGLVMTDWYTTQELTELQDRVDAIYPGSSSVGCAHAGNDLQMPGCDKNIKDLVQAVNTEKKIDGYTISLEDLQFISNNIIRIIARTADGE